MMKAKQYEQPLAECMELTHEGNFCATTLTTDSSRGLESWTNDTEGEWDDEP